MSINQIHNDYYDPDRYYGKPPDETTKPPIHWAIRKLVRQLVGNLGLYQFYRSTYHATDCGPSIGFLIDGKWSYCDDLMKRDQEVYLPPTRSVMPKLKVSRANWRLDSYIKALQQSVFWHTHTVTGICVSSIVEGSDAEVPPVRIEGDKKRFEQVLDEWCRAVEHVNAEVNYLWERDNTQWLILHHEEHGPVYFKHTQFSEPEFSDGDEDLVPDEILSLVVRLTSSRCNNCAYDDVALKDGWTLSAYEVCD